MHKRQGELRLTCGSKHGRKKGCELAGKKFAIDFDDTFTADPAFWAEFIKRGKERGHSFCMVTARKQTEENTDLINGMLDQYGCQMCIYFTNLRSKLLHMGRLGIKIDIWIDDDPETLVRGH